MEHNSEVEQLRAENARLREALRQCLNYIEHSEANKGKLTSDSEWDANVEAFRKSGISRIGIGRSYTDKAFVDLDKARAALSSDARTEAKT